jgi:hypothetical protein
MLISQNPRMSGRITEPPPPTPTEWLLIGLWAAIHVVGGIVGLTVIAFALFGPFLK